MVSEEHAMAVGNLWRRSAPGLAVALVMGLAGCQSLPVPRAHPAFKAGGDDANAGPAAGKVAPAPTPAAIEAAVPQPGASPLAAANEPLPPLPTENTETPSAQPGVIAEFQTEPENPLAPDPNPHPKAVGPRVDPVLDELIAKAQAYREQQASLESNQSPPPIQKDPEPAPELLPDAFPLVPDPLGDILSKATSPSVAVDPPVATDVRLAPETTDVAVAVAVETPPAEVESRKQPETSGSEASRNAHQPEPPANGSEVSPGEETTETPKATSIPATDSPATPELAITDLRLCRRVLGFGNFMPLDSLACKAGQTVLLYCEMDGVRYQPHDSQFRSRIASRVAIVPELGGAPVWVQTLGEADDTCNHPRHDYYVNYRFELPHNLGPGSYQLRLTQTDLHTEQTATHALSFSIRP